MIFNVFQAAIGAFFMVMSFQPTLKIGRRGQRGPATPTFRASVCLIGLVAVIDAAIKLFGGPGIEIPLKH